MKFLKLILALILIINFSACLDSAKKENNLAPSESDNNIEEVELPKPGVTSPPKSGSSTIVPSPKSEDPTIFSASKNPDLNETLVIVHKQDTKIYSWNGSELANLWGISVKFINTQDGENLFVVMNEPIAACQFFHYLISSSKLTCIESEINILSNPQTNHSGEVYYHSTEGSSSKISKWNPISKNKSDLITGQIKEFLVHKNGNAVWEDHNQNLFYLNTSSQNIQLASNIGSVFELKFIDSDTILYRSKLNLQSITKIQSLTTQIAFEIYPNYQFRNFQTTQNGLLFMLDQSNLYEHTSTGAQAINLMLSSIIEYKAIDDKLYVFGELNGLQQILVYDTSDYSENIIYTANILPEDFLSWNISKNFLFLESDQHPTSNSLLQIDDDNDTIEVATERAPIKNWISLDQKWNPSLLEELIHGF